MQKDTQGTKGQFRLECFRFNKKTHRLAYKLLKFFGLKNLALDVREKYSIKKWDTGFMSNLITSAGKAQLALLAGDASATPFTYLELGTSSTAVNVSQTALQAAITDSGLARAAATVSRVTTTVMNDTLQLVYEWTVSGTKAIEEIGIFNASSAGTMLGRALTTTKSVVSGDSLEATYKVIFA